MPSKDSLSWKQGIKRLKNPVWPLARISLLLFLTGPYEKLESLLDELPSPMDLEDIIYNEPTKKLLSYIEILRPIELLKSGRKCHSEPVEESETDIPLILGQKAVPLEPLEALTVWIQQAVLGRELEKINSLLCSPCNCTICCTGPEYGSKKEFFEIPLKEDELPLFDLPRHEYASFGLPEDDLINSSPALYNWKKTWRLILPKGSRCPHLSRAGKCTIYEKRPDVCRKPQIFPYVIQNAILSLSKKDEQSQAFIKEEKLLAIWDCPYVRELKEEIIQYGQKCGLETVFMENKI